MNRPLENVVISANCRGFTPQKLWESLKPIALRKAASHPRVPLAILLSDVPSDAYLSKVRLIGGSFFNDPEIAKLFSVVALKKKDGDKLVHVGFWPKEKV